MLQLDVPPSWFRQNVAHRLRRYIHLSVLQRYVHVSVASGPVPDVEGFVPDIAHIACHTTGQFAYGESPLSPPQQDAGYPAEVLYEERG